MRKRKGFTLMELIIVVIIIAILAAIGLPQFFKAAGKAKEGAAKSNLGSIRKVQLAYESLIGAWVPMNFAAGAPVLLQVDIDNSDSDNNHTTGTDVQVAFTDVEYSYVLGGNVVTATPKTATLTTFTMNMATGAANW